MTIDDSFVKPGAVPFKWEIRPGVPKFQTQHHQQQQNQPLSTALPQSPPNSCNNHGHTLSSPPFPSPSKLTPPPSWSPLFSLMPETRTRSFRSSARTRSERWRFGRSGQIRPDNVSAGCFPSPLLVRRKQSNNNSSSKRMNLTTGAEFEVPDHSCDLETLAQWSVSSRRSLLSPSSSSFSSYQSSPPLLKDFEWAGFGLF